jgi:hypothetical protein
MPARMLLLTTITAGMLLASGPAGAEEAPSCMPPSIDSVTVRHLGDLKIRIRVQVHDPDSPMGSVSTWLGRPPGMIHSDFFGLSSSGILTNRWTFKRPGRYRIKVEADGIEDMRCGIVAPAKRVRFIRVR